MKKTAAVFLFCVLSGCASDSVLRAPDPSPDPSHPTPPISPETTLAAPTHPSEPPLSQYYLDDGPPENYSIDLAAIPDAVPKAEPVHPARNRPYRAFGKIYRPFASPRPHRETGVASWYGRRYHGRKTASGEVYDMFKMTAAHPILTIPSYARVTRADTGESVVVRVNDRGPFLRGRVIDLSYAAARRLGIVRAGSAQVVVESVLPAGAPSVAPTVAEAKPAVEQDASPFGSQMFFIQLGAFSDHVGAGRMLADFQKAAPEKFRELGVIVFDSLAGLHRVGAGKYPSAESARADLRALCDSGLCGFVAPLP